VKRALRSVGPAPAIDVGLGDSAELAIVIGGATVTVAGVKGARAIPQSQPGFHSSLAMAQVGALPERKWPNAGFYRPIREDLMKIGVWSNLALATLFLSGCSGGNANEQAAEPVAATDDTPVQPAPVSADAKGHVIPVSAQGVAEVGLTVRVKSVELGADATILDISASYGGTASGDVDLAFSQTFIRDEQGNKLMLKRIADNQDLKIRAGEQMDGRLVFLGAVPPSAKSITLVLNEGNDGSAITGPGLNIPIELKTGAQ
jgi:hypothetical protein